MPLVPLVATQVEQSPRLARLRLEDQLETAHLPAIHVVVEYDLALVIRPEPRQDTKHTSDIRSSHQTQDNKPGLEDFAEQLCFLPLRDLLLAVHEEEVAVIVEACVVEGWPDPLTVGPAGSSLPLQESWRRGLELSPGFVVLLKC